MRRLTPDDDPFINKANTILKLNSESKATSRLKSVIPDYLFHRAGLYKYTNQPLIFFREMMMSLRILSLIHPLVRAEYDFLSEEHRRAILGHGQG